MTDQDKKEQSKLRVADIACPKTVIHPALDWVSGQLVVGVVFKDGNRAVLTSKDGLVEIEKIGNVCERDGKFESPVTPEMAEQFIAYLATNPASCPREDLNALLLELAVYFNQFVVFPERHWSRVIASWTLGTYLYPMFQAYPYLWLTSPAPGCGKSLLGQILANLSFNGEFMASPTEANMFHLPEQNRGVQVWDEVEFANQVEKSRFQSVKAILLNGYRNGGVVPRQVGNSWDKQVKYHVYCPRVLIGLSRLPETARQRSIELTLQKRKSEQEVKLYRIDDQAAEETRLRTKCVLTALKCAHGINQSYKDNRLRKELEALLGIAGREVDDIWLPVFAVVAACSPDAEIDPAEDSLIGDLGKAASQLTEFRANQISRDTSPLPGPATASGPERGVCEETHEALVAALDFVGSVEGIEPSDLAKMVSKKLKRGVSSQLLSKGLAQLGIRAVKHNGRRVFIVRLSEIREAQVKLGIVPPPSATEAESGHQGQEGQQPSENTGA